MLMLDLFIGCGMALVVGALFAFGEVVIKARRRAREAAACQRLDEARTREYWLRVDVEEEAGRILAREELQRRLTQ